MDSASSGADASRVEVGRSYNTGIYRSRDGLLFPPTSPVLTSAISSTLFASSFSSLRSSTEREVLHRADPTAEEQQRIWDDIQRRRIEEREAEMRRLEQNEEQLKLAEEQRHILEEIQ